MSSKCLGLYVYLLLVCIVVMLHLGAVQEVVDFWRKSLVYDHGALLTLFVIVTIGVDIAREPVFEHPLKLTTSLVILVVGLLLLVASMATVMLGQMILLPVLVWICVAAIYGREVGARFTFLFLALVFSWPVWDVLIEPLQSATIAVTNSALESFGRTAYVDGDQVLLRYGTFVVERGCAGLNFLLVGPLLGVIYGYRIAIRTSDRIIILIISAILAVVSNWLRVIIIVMAGDLTDMEHFLVDQHSVFGWVLFAVVMSAIIPLGRFIETRRLDQSVTRKVADERVTARGSHSGKIGVNKLVKGGVLLSILALPPVVQAMLEKSAGPSTFTNIVLPDSLGDWVRAPIVLQTKDSPVFDSASSFEVANYISGTKQVTVWGFSYDLRDRGRELVGYPNYWYDRSTWHNPVPLGANWPSANSFFAPRIIRIEKALSSRALVGGYMIGNSIVSNTLEAKIRGVSAFVLGQYHTAAIVLSVDCDKPNCLGASEALQELSSEIQAYGRNRVMRKGSTDE
jgi:exosortase